MISKTVLLRLAGPALLGVLLGLTGPTLAQETAGTPQNAPAAQPQSTLASPPQTSPAPPPQKPLSAERLAMPLFPGGWKEVVTDRGNIDVIEYVPNGETITAWRNKITLEVYHEMNTLPLDAMQRRAQGQNRDACEGAVEGRFQSGMNNGYPSAFWILGCKRNRDSGMGETRYTKAIQGAQRMYILTRAWRTPAFGDNGPEIPQRALEDAVAFLTTTVACSDGDPKHACPVISKK